MTCAGSRTRAQACFREFLFIRTLLSRRYDGNL